jgi:hypothetical protein
MKTLRTMLVSFDRAHASRSKMVRARVRRAPACESLEGRQLLNAAWGPPPGLGGWDGAAGPGAGVPPHVHPFGVNGAPEGHHALKPGAAHKGGPGHGPAGHNFTPPSAQLQADFKTLQTDQQALQAEVPASVTAAVKADQAVIEKAFSSLTHAEMKALHPGGPRATTPPGDPTANLAADLTAAGISSDQANAIVADFQNLKSTLSTIDPTLQAKITADQAAIVKDGGPSKPMDGPGGPGGAVVLGGGPGMPGKM